MQDTVYFQVNGQKVIHETLDDEVIIVNLDTGTYYSLDSSAVWVWHALLGGYSLNHIIAAGLAGFTASESEIAEAVTRFLDHLQAEGLIIPANSAPDKVVQDKDVLYGSRNPGEKHPFSEPRLERYTDMQDLMLLDPIHDVDESGWPNTTHQGQA